MKKEQASSLRIKVFAMLLISTIATLLILVWITPVLSTSTLDTTDRIMLGLTTTTNIFTCGVVWITWSYSLRVQTKYGIDLSKDPQGGENDGWK